MIDSITWFDWISWGGLFTSMLWGAFRGLLREMISLVGWLFSLWLAQGQFQRLAQMLPVPDLEVGRWALAFGLLFFGSQILLRLVMMIFNKAIETTGMGAADHTLGALFGLLRALTFLVMFGVLVKAIGWTGQPWWQSSSLAGGITWLMAWLGPQLPLPWASYF